MFYIASNNNSTTQSFAIRPRFIAENNVSCVDGSDILPGPKSNSIRLPVTDTSVEILLLIFCWHMNMKCRRPRFAQLCNDLQFIDWLFLLSLLMFSQHTHTRIYIYNSASSITEFRWMLKIHVMMLMHEPSNLRYGHDIWEITFFHRVCEV